MFKAIAYAEQVHATNHFNALGDLYSTEENLETAINGENFEVEEKYPAYNCVAKMQEEKQAVQAINAALSAEKIHAAMYEKAKQSVISGKDIETETIFICSICGYTVEKETPERCPVCGVVKDKFSTF